MFRYFSLGGLFGSILFTLMTIICSGLRNTYDHIDQFISELGATNTKHASLMNYGGFIPSGLMIILFSIFLFHRLSRSIIGRIASVLVGLFGAGMLLAGYFSCDEGCPQAGGSFDSRMHDGISGPSFLSVIIAIFLFSFALRISADWKRFWIYTLISSLLAVTFMILLISSLESREQTGLWQRLLLLVIFQWLSVISINLYTYWSPVNKSLTRINKNNE